MSMLSCGVVTCAALSLATAWASASTGIEPCFHVLPYDDVRGLTVVSLEVGESGPLDFVLDSGADRTSLNDVSLARTLSLRFGSSGRGRGVGGDALRVLIAPDVAVRANGRELLRTDLAVHDVAPILAEHAGRTLHGLLGKDLFAHFVVEIDPERGLVILHDPASFEYRGPGRVVPLAVEAGRPIVRARVVNAEGRAARVRLLIDTGSSSVLALMRGSHRNLRPPDDHELVDAHGVGGSAAVATGRIRRLELAGLTLEEPMVSFFSSQSMPAIRSVRKVNGLLGNGFLRRYRAYFDMTRERLILEPLSVQ